MALFAGFHAARSGIADRQRRGVRAPGCGGSFGIAGPSAGIGYAHVTSQMATSLSGDPRDLAPRDALDSIPSSAAQRQVHRA